MAMTINTNVISINAQRNLGLSGSSLGTTMQRLSSGLRVNSAKDDAAGLAIAERMNAQAKGLKVAARNANDGISLAQTAEGALGKVGDMLQRMRELAVQSSNATNSADDRKALQAEVSQLRSEIDRVGKTTSFNGKKILDGSFAGGVFQVGSNAGDNITVGGITNAKADALGRATYGSNVSATITATDITSLVAIEEADTLQIRVGSDAAIDLGPIAQASSGQERLGQLVAAINAKTADTGVTAFLMEDDAIAGQFTMALRSESDRGISLTGFTPSATGVGLPASSTIGFSSTAYSGAISLIDAELGAATLAGVTVAEVAAIFTAVTALDASATAPLGSTAAAAAVASALSTFAATISGLGVKTVGDATTATSYPSTTTISGTELTAWRTATNQYDGNGATSYSSTAETSLTQVQDALRTLKADLAPAVDAQRAANLQTVRDALTTAVALTDMTALQTSMDAGGALNTAVTAAGLTMPSVPAFTTAEEFLAAKDQLVADINYQLSGNFGIQTSQVSDDHIGLTDIDISTQSGSWAAIKHIDAAIDQVNSARADLGALQTRFEKSIENIDIMNENISAARGRIVDADFAFETANLSRAQILQQAGTAMVAQANQLPQQVLSLLQ